MQVQLKSWFPFLGSCGQNCLFQREVNFWAKSRNSNDAICTACWNIRKSLLHNRHWQDTLITWTIRFFQGQHFPYLIFNSNWGFVSSKHWMILLANGWQISETKASRNLHSFHPPWWACWNGFWEQCEELHGPAKITQLNYFSNWDKSRSYYKLNLSNPEKN